MNTEERAQAIMNFVQNSDIPEQYHTIIQTIILYMTEHPDSTLMDACRIYAKQHQCSGQTVYRTFRQAVLSGWENAVTPSSLLYSRRMSPEKFVQAVIARLK